MALIFVTIRIDNICFDDGSQQSFFLPNKKLSAPMKKKNQFDMFAIKVYVNVKIVGHLPIELCRPTKYL